MEDRLLEKGRAVEWCGPRERRTPNRLQCRRLQSEVSRTVGWYRRIRGLSKGGGYRRGHFWGARIWSRPCNSYPNLGSETRWTPVGSFGTGDPDSELKPAGARMSHTGSTVDWNSWSSVPCMNFCMLKDYDYSPLHSRLMHAMVQPALETEWVSEAGVRRVCPSPQENQSPSIFERWIGWNPRVDGSVPTMPLHYGWGVASFKLHSTSILYTYKWCLSTFSCGGWAYGCTLTPLPSL
jgi:hypothetical protein